MSLCTQQATIEHDGTYVVARGIFFSHTDTDTDTHSLSRPLFPSHTHTSPPPTLLPPSLPLSLSPFFLSFFFLFAHVQHDLVPPYELSAWLSGKACTRATSPIWTAATKKMHRGYVAPVSPAFYSAFRPTADHTRPLVCLQT